MRAEGTGRHGMSSYLASETSSGPLILNDKSDPKILQNEAKRPLESANSFQEWSKTKPMRTPKPARTGLNLPQAKRAPAQAFYE